MRTSKPFSTVTYNSPSFLKIKLDELSQRNIIDFYAFIEHLPEEDEGKKHIHLFIVPSGLMDTTYMKTFLAEPDEEHPDNPLTCISCRSSKFGDWYMYELHDEKYLASKGQSRKFHYTQDEFKVSCQDYFLNEIHLIDRSKMVGHERIVTAAKNNIPFRELCLLGQVPVQLIKQYEYLYECVRMDETFRADRQTHTPKDEPKRILTETFEQPEVSPEETPVYLFDEETGEVVKEITVKKEKK